MSDETMNPAARDEPAPPQVYESGITPPDKLAAAIHAQIQAGLKVIEASYETRIAALEGAVSALKSNDTVLAERIADQRRRLDARFGEEGHNCPKCYKRLDARQRTNCPFCSAALK